MSLPSTYPLANVTAQPRPAGGGTFDRVEKLVLHTTETRGWPGYGDFAPHLTYDPWQHLWRQHVPLTRSSTTLADGSSTKVRENRDYAIQVEIVAYCDPKLVAKYGFGIDDLDDRAVRDLADLAAWLHENGGLELELADGWLPYPYSAGNTRNRMTGPEYDAFRGVLGHEHVSTNDHGDPGAPPWLAKFLRYAKGATGESTTDEGIKGMTKDVGPFRGALDQPLAAGENALKLNKDGDLSVVLEASDGVDVGVILDVRDDTGARVEVASFWRAVSYKDGTTTTIVRDTLPVRGDLNRYAGPLKDKVATGRKLRLRLVIVADRPGLVLRAFDVSGWAK